MVREGRGVLEDGEEVLGGLTLVRQTCLGEESSLTSTRTLLGTLGALREV